MAQLNSTKHNQTGAALVVAIVLMALLTSLAVTLMYNSSLDTKMSNAAVLKKTSTNMALGGVNEFINKAQNSDVAFGGRNPLSLNNDIDSVALTGTDLTASAQSNVADSTNCPHFKRAQASDSYIRCNRFEIKVEHKYGQNKQAKTEIVTSVASQIPGDS
ncbi:pilus assembly PilX N-terminal domain-containing protein [Catenovulum sp. 2E275]|uniref:pilus assembly PilX family protein n=1 Tax=Catenovulum sp. 2E275 TaxID=2980497 RepID=UPI0021D0ACDE|nr:pilus assembly PilX N-terminal domain-containing protein [Catenovulum sp. 2E275]MCU4676280.1 pilus assembly PilX N-terminal domain-containing protein [Catenovulum sp. 2E275]